MNETIRHIFVPIGNPRRVPAAQLRKAATIARASTCDVLIVKPLNRSTQASRQKATRHRRAA